MVFHWSYYYYYYSLRVFHISFSGWFFHWSLSDSESPRVSRTLLSILAVLNSAVVWMVLTHPKTSKSSNPLNNPFATVPKALIAIGTIVTFMFHSSFFFSIPLQGQGTYPSFHILSVLFSGQPGQQSPQFCKFSFFVDYYKVWSSSRDLVIPLYVKVPQEFMRVIFSDRCGVVHIPFVRMVKFKFLAHLPVDHLAQQVVSSFMLLLC